MRSFVTPTNNPSEWVGYHIGGKPSRHESLACHREDRILPEHLPLAVRRAQPTLGVARVPETWEELKEFKHRLQKESVAEAVGMLRPNFRALMKRYGIKRDEA